jgi:hypothetical protein
MLSGRVCLFFYMYSLFSHPFWYHHRFPFDRPRGCKERCYTYFELLKTVHKVDMERRYGLPLQHPT